MQFLKNFFAPFILIKREKFYIGWIVYAIVFGMFNLIADLFSGNRLGLTNYFETGQFYTFSIALCAPLVIDLLLGMKVEHGLTQKVHFLKYKLFVISIAIVFIFITSALWSGNFRGSLKAQLLITVISLFLSYYMFLIGHMQEHADITQKYDDKGYLEEEKNRLEATKEKLNETSEVELKGGKVSI